MSYDDLERRIELLENDVEVLTAALRSALSWRIGSTKTIAIVNNPANDFRVVGQAETKEILDALPPTPGS